MNIPLFKISTDERDVEAVTKVIRRGNNWANGPEIEELEHMTADYVGVNYAVAFNSGTSALHAALLAIGIGKDHWGERDRVVVPSMTFPATANVVLAVDAKPIFCDIEEETYGLDYDSLQEIGKWAKISCIMPVDVGGCICRDAGKIAEHMLSATVIEDAAESLGATAEGVNAGAFGDMAMFSLCAPKIITSGEGGLLTVDDVNVRDRLIRIRDHGNPDRKTLGYNWRMSSMTASLAKSQLGRIEEMIEKRRWNAEYLRDLLTIPQARMYGFGVDKGKLTLPTAPTGFRHIYQMFTIRVQEKDRDPLLDYLHRNGIGAKVYFPPVHLMPLYRKLGWKEGDLPITERVAKEVITLPMYPDLTVMEMDYMAYTIEKYFRRS